MNDVKYVSRLDLLPEPYPAFRKIPRLNRDMVVTEKVDGTNGLIRIAEGTLGYPGGLISAGSRNRWLAPGKGTDNFGFAQWVLDNAEALVTALGPGDHYGEWYGQGIQRTYGLTEKRFALFNVDRYGASELAGHGVPGLCIVPTLFVGPFSLDTINSIVLDLSMRGSVIVPGFEEPEGVVVFHSASRQLFKVTCEGDEAPKGRV